MTEVDERLAALESRRLESGLTVAEQNELRDCEITLGMTTAGPRERSEAARRVERFAAERGVPHPLYAYLDATVDASRNGFAPKLELFGTAKLEAFLTWAHRRGFAVAAERRTGRVIDVLHHWDLAEIELSGGGRISVFGDHDPVGGGR